jgi:hypothetical protein
VSMLVVMNGWSSLSQRGQREKSGSVRDTHFEMRGRLVAKKNSNKRLKGNLQDVRVMLEALSEEVAALTYFSYWPLPYS